MELVKLAKVKVHHVISSNDEKGPVVEEVLSVLDAPSSAQLVSLANIVYLHTEHQAIAKVLFDVPSQVPEGDDDVVEDIC
jgi:hypothetical protein